MNKLTPIALLSIFWLTSTECYAASPGQAEVIQLIKAEDIQDASAMSQAVDGMSNKVMECVQSKLAPASECFCRYPKELSHLRKVYEDTLKHHPNWKDKAVSYMRDDKGHAVSFSGMSRQLEIKCQQSR